MNSRILPLLLAVSFHVTDASVLTVSKAQPQDGITSICDDARLSYLPEQVEAVSLDPFCLAVVISNGSATQTLWHECVTAGRLIRSSDEMHVTYAIPGGPGHSLNLVASNPIGNANTDLKVIARFVVSSKAASVPDAGVK